MKALFLALMTVTIFSVSFHSEPVATAATYRATALDLLDPSWPKLA